MEDTLFRAMSVILQKLNKNYSGDTPSCRFLWLWRRVECLVSQAVQTYWRSDESLKEREWRKRLAQICLSSWTGSITHIIDYLNRIIFTRCVLLTSLIDSLRVSKNFSAKYRGGVLLTILRFCLFLTFYKMTLSLY